MLGNIKNSLENLDNIINSEEWIKCTGNNIPP